MKNIGDMNHSELEATKEEIDRCLFEISQKERISQLEQQIEMIKSSSFEHSKQHCTEEEFDYTHR